MEPLNGVDIMFLEKLKKEIDANLTNEQFSVEELAKNIGMSRSQLHRKLIVATGQSVSQFIREYRLDLGMELLREGELTAAEVAHQIGFGSPTYFSKCFTEYYGFPPGLVKNKSIHIETANQKDKSIAILPFKNLSEDQRNAYFSEGVIEAIQTYLSQIRSLRIISRTSLERYRTGAKPIREIAGELGVSALLEGSIQRDNNKVRIDVRLVDGNTEGLVWAKSYDRELSDVFAIQSEIARRVAHELQTQLSPEEQFRFFKTDTENPKAYDLYLKGIYEYRTYTNKGAHNAIEFLTQAIDLDPEYARAYAFLANSYIGLATIWGAELSASEAFKKGKPLIDKALELDPDLDEGHMLMGFYKLYHDWDFRGAEASYKLAINSGHPDALAIYIDFLNFVRRHQEAMEWAERLNLQDPYYPNSRVVHSCVHNGCFEEALVFSESRLNMFNNYLTLDSHGFLLLNMKRYDESIEFFNKAISFQGIRYPRMLGWMGAAYALSGDLGGAAEIITELKERLAQNEKGSLAFFIAVIYAAMNEQNSALYWLKVAYESHDMEMPWLISEPQFFKLHSDPEFQQLVSLIGFI